MPEVGLAGCLHWLASTPHLAGYARLSGLAGTASTPTCASTHSQTSSRGRETRRSSFRWEPQNASSSVCAHCTDGIAQLLACC